MGILATVKNKAVGAYNAAATVVGPHKTDICFVGGMLVLVGGIVCLCKASAKLPAKTEELETSINDIAAKVADKEITEEQAQKDIRNVKVQAGCGIVKDFVIGAGLTAAGVAIAAKAYKDVKDDKNRIEKAAAGMAIAYAKLQDFTNNYRARVVAEEGVAKDTHYAFGTTPVETTTKVINPDGTMSEQKVTMAKTPPDININNDLSLLCIYPSNPIWRDDPGMLLTFIKGRFNDAEGMLYTKGKISRNDIADLFLIDKDYSIDGLRPGYIFDKTNSGRQIDYTVHFVTRDTAAKTKYIPQGARGLENYVIIELKNLNPDITVPRYRFQ